LAKHVLHSGEDYDFMLLGIVCPEDQYRMCGMLNDALRINLRLSDFVPLSLKGGRVFKFSLFRFADEELGLEYFFVPNTSNFEPPPTVQKAGSGLFSEVEVDESTRLVKELPKTDYFLILKGEYLHNRQFKIMDALKTIVEIIQVQSIQPNELASRRNLIF
jgi:hypothetical protein